MREQHRDSATRLILHTLVGLGLAACLVLSATAGEMDRPQEAPHAELSALLTRHVREVVAHSPGLPIKPAQRTGSVEVRFYPDAGWVVIHLSREFLPQADPVENEDLEQWLGEDVRLVLGDAFPVRRLQVLYDGREIHSYFPER